MRWGRAACALAIALTTGLLVAAVRVRALELRKRAAEVADRVRDLEAEHHRLGRHLVEALEPERLRARWRALMIRD